MRSSRNASTAGQGRGGIVDAVSIRDRPAEVADRLVHGHWEGDLTTGSRNGHIATLVERHSRFVPLVKVVGKDTENVIDALIKYVNGLPIPLTSTLTWDRGTELAGHVRFTRATNVKGLLRRCEEPVAARDEREHEWAAAPVLRRSCGVAPRHSHELSRNASTVSVGRYRPGRASAGVVSASAFSLMLMSAWT
jgi:hypothetical protein